jgi:hypothetical protein
MLASAPIFPFILLVAGLVLTAIAFVNLKGSDSSLYTTISLAFTTVSTFLILITFVVLFRGLYGAVKWMLVWAMLFTIPAGVLMVLTAVNTKTQSSFTITLSAGILLLLASVLLIMSVVWASIHHQSFLANLAETALAKTLEETIPSPIMSYRREYPKYSPVERISRRPVRRERLNTPTSTRASPEPYDEGVRWWDEEEDEGVLW